MDDQRKIEELERLLSGGPEAADEEVNGLFLLARGLQRAADASRAATPAMRPDFRAALRTQLVEQASGVVPLALHRRVRASVGARNTTMRRSFRSVVAVAAAVVIMLVAGSLVALAQNAVPGDTLYGLKMAREDLALHAVFGRVPKAGREMALARERLDEMKTLLDRGARAQALYVRPLKDMDARTLDATKLLIIEYRDSKRSAVLQPLVRFTAAQKQGLESIVDEIPPGARPEARSAIEVLNAVQNRVQNVLGGCPCPADVLAPPTNVPKGTPGRVSCSCSATASGRTATQNNTQAAQPSQPQQNPPQQPSGPGPQPGDKGLTLDTSGVSQIDQQVNGVITGLLQDLGVSSPAPLPTVPSSVTVPAPSTLSSLLK